VKNTYGTFELKKRNGISDINLTELVASAGI
jgi:hypothetical protein